MSLIARRLLSNSSILRCSLSSFRFLTKKSINLSRLSQPKAKFQVYSQNYSTQNAELKAKFDSLVKKNKVVLFMKGTPDRPMCGFSKAVVNILQIHGAPFESHNVLADESIRSGIKEYTGEFIGGCDILMEMHRSGDIIEELEKIGIKSKAPEKQ